MLPSLEGAEAWLNRAEEHLHDLKLLCDGLAKAECDTMMASLHFDAAQPGVPSSWGYTKPTTPVPLRVSILTGEAIQAMRRSLDYLVYELAFLDSGSPQEDTQFPIDESKNVFWSRTKRKTLKSRRIDHSCYLIGVSPEHAAVLERYQPYPGNAVGWTTMLKSLSNPDKHRHLIIARNESSTNVLAGAPGSTHGQILRTSHDSFVILIHIRHGMYMKFTISAFVAFESRVRIIETLDQLHAEVGNVLEEFKPCFLGKCPH